MALNEEWVQNLLSYRATLAAPDEALASDSGSVGRASIDGCIVVYDLEDPPAWLVPILNARNEDGDLELTFEQLYGRPQLQHERWIV